MAGPSVAVDDSTGDEPKVTTSNLDLVLKLSPMDRCLFEHGVYPAGGVGYEDSSLPYDNASPADRAFLTFRAETLRHLNEWAVEVSPTFDEAGTLIAATTTVTAGSWLADRTPESIGEWVSDDYRAAVRDLHGLGVATEMRPTALYGLASSCTVRSFVAGGGLWSDSSIPKDTVFVHGTDLQTGQFQVRVAAPLLGATSALLAQFGDRAAVSVLEETPELDGRYNSYSPRIGGSRILDPGAPNFPCTDAFRIGNTLTTAGHCGYRTWRSPMDNLVVGTTSAAYDLTPGNVDVNIVYGQSYTNRVWVGGILGTSTLLTTGVVDPALVPIDGSGGYLFSGASSGQGNVIVSNKYQCITTASGTKCQILVASNPGGFQCTGGDSGGVWALWDPSVPKLVPLASHSASSGTSANKTCFGTAMYPALFLYGGAVIG